MRDRLLNLSIVAVSCAYAHWLDTHKHIEPDHTWVEVAIGVGYTLAAARGKTHIIPPNDCSAVTRWLARDAHIYEAFAYASIPIIAGEIAQWLQRRRARAQYAARWGMEQ